MKGAGLQVQAGQHLQQAKATERRGKFLIHQHYTLQIWQGLIVATNHELWRHRRNCDCDDRRSTSRWYCSGSSQGRVEALPISLGSMAVTGGLIYNGVWKSSPRFGPFPKLAVAGILGYALGKASYMGTCRSKFQQLGVGPGLEPWGSGAGGRFGPWGGSGHGHRSCNHVCEECKKKVPAAPAQQQQS